MKVELHEAARQELNSIFGWYNDADKSIGREFLTEVKRTLTRLKQFPLSHAIQPNGVRRAPLAKFHFVIWYSAEPGAIYVYAISHTSREPDYWLGRKN